MLRLASIVAAVVLLLGASGCGVLMDSDEPAEPESCGDCEPEAADLRARIEEIPEVTRVKRLEYVPAKSLRRDATVSMDLAVERGGIDAVRAAALKAAWLSDLTPLEKVTLNLVPAGGALVTEIYSFRSDEELASYEEEWGPRPVE